MTLSGCETALPGTQRASAEAVGPVTAFLRAGAKGVIASLWIVDDLATMFLMKAVYAGLAEGGTAPQCLRSGQIWLRGVTVGEILAFLEDEAEMGAAAAVTEVDRATILARLDGASSQDRPFESPVHWGGFIAVAA